MSRKARAGRLALRLYALGLAQLSILAIAAVLFAFLTQPPPPPRFLPPPIAFATADRVAATLDESGDLATTLAELSTQYNVDLTVWDAQSQVVASTTTPPVALSDHPSHPRGRH